MTTCCPNCSATTALGTETLSACAECASVSIAGGSLPVGLIVAATLGTGALLVIVGAARRGRFKLIQTRSRLATG